jgi:alkaline phosphatase D
MLKLHPSFFVHTGDIVYYDKLAKSPELARYHWQRTYSLPTNVRFHRRVPSYFIKDDHDTWQNDCWPTMKRDNMGTFTFAQGVAIFLEQVPMRWRTARTYRWGRDLQIWLVEGRDFRSANDAPDGPDKTIWGERQKAWFRRTVERSDATFKVLISPTPLVGPDRDNKRDNHSNKGFTHEGNELREFISRQRNMVVVCGDRHWQYVSVHPESGVREYCCGPVSNKHAGGWKQDDLRPSHHKYLNVVGGFLAATVERIDGRPTLTFRHYSVDGEVLNEDQLVAK